MRDSLLSDAIARSRPLSAYLDPDEDAGLPSEFDPDDLLDDWQDVFDSEAEFRERLTFSDHTVESVRARLEAASERQDSDGPADDRSTSERPEAIPSEFETAERVVDRAVSADPEAARPLRDRHEGTAFVHLVAPLAAGITAELDLDTEFAPTAVESLEDWLFERLTKTFRHPLFILFKAYQQTEYPDREFADATDSTEVYDEFVAEHLDAGYERIFEAYPLLLKLLGVVADQWLGMVHRLDDRIEADRAALARTFDDGSALGRNEGSALGRVADVETLSDDPHGEGEIVLRVAFENDCTVVYKPRSVAGEAAFGEVLDWTNARAAVPDLYVPAVLDRDEYGWMEFTPHGACDSPEAVGRYYERMGGLTALAFVLGSTDLHHDNIVAMGEHPVIVDGETVLSPRVGTSNKPISPAMDSLLEDSVLDTVLIPFGKDGDGSGNDLTTNGLSELTDEEHRQKLPNFRHPNTDAMDLGFDKAYRFDGRNLPRLDGEVQEAADFLAELKRGFRAVTDAVLANREAFLAPSGPLAAFEGSSVRYLLRPTGHYASKLSESLYSSKLRSGVEQSLALESLYTIFVPRDDDGDLWKLVATETETLRRLTIPRFTVPATGRELKDGRGTRLGTTVAESPIDHARQRVADLDDHWVETQLRLVELAFTGSTVSDPVSAPSDANADSLASADSAREVVSTVVELIDDATTPYPDGSLRWAELARSSPKGQFLVREPNPGLYEGYVGVGLFLAAVAAVRDDDELADRSRRVLESARLAFESDGTDESDATDQSDGTDEAGGTDDLSLGGITGRGSVAYGLLTAGRLLGDDDLVESARNVARRTTRDEIAADAKLDVMAGSAGELLAQLAIYEATGDEAALERARWCGDHLLEATDETDSGYRVPTSDEADRRFGFAHGVGGVGYALIKLGSVTGEDAYASVGRDALELDADLWRRHHDDTEGNGTGRDGIEGDGTDHDDADRNDGSGTIWGWCNGIAGVGTSRVAVADSVTSSGAESFSVVREDLRTALSHEDSLCCGSAGRALFLLDAGDVFGEPSLTVRGEDLFENLLDRAEREGRLRLANHLPMLPRLGLFTGLAGVGYLALQFEAREADVELPNVTRLE